MTAFETNNTIYTFGSSEPDPKVTVLHRTPRNGLTDSIGDTVVVETAGLAGVQIGRSAHLILVDPVSGATMPLTTSKVVDLKL
jgi:hypothetical protein